MPKSHKRFYGAEDRSSEIVRLISQRHTETGASVLLVSSFNRCVLGDVSVDIWLCMTITSENRERIVAVAIRES